ncbi:MAG: aldose 1-epimerase family protein [Flavobacteriales bacterium]
MKKLVLENEYLEVGILQKGAELCSLVDKHDGVEHMWKANPAFWPRHAPILFPCVGESKEGKITVEGTEYPMGRHGFARHEHFAVVSQEKNKAVLELNADPGTLRQFPFDFKLQVTYELINNKLLQSFRVTNTGINNMGFQLGGHPAFSVPFLPSERYDDYEIGFDEAFKQERHLLTNGGLYSGETRVMAEHANKIPLSTDLFKEDALVFKEISPKQVWIQNKKGGKKLEMDYAEFPHLGIWSIPGAEYVCLEPWVGCADDANQEADFFKKDSLIVLNAGESYNSAFSVSLVNS